MSSIKDKKGKKKAKKEKQKKEPEKEPNPLVAKFRDTASKMIIRRYSGKMHTVTDEKLERQIGANIEHRYLHESKLNGEMWTIWQKICKNALSSAADSIDVFNTAAIYMKTVGGMSTQSLRNLKTAFNIQPKATALLKASGVNCQPPQASGALPDRDVEFADILKILQEFSLTRKGSVLAINIVSYASYGSK